MDLVHFSQHKVLLAEASSTFQAMRLSPLAPAPLERNDAVHPHQKRKLPEGLGRGGGGSAVHPMCHPFTGTSMILIDLSHVPLDFP